MSEFYLPLGQLADFAPPNHLAVSEIGKPLVLRAGEFKAKWQTLLFSEHPDKVRKSSDWDEDGSPSVSPTRSAANKSIPLQRELSPILEEINFAVDVVVADESGRIHGKPKSARSVVEIERLLNELLGGNCARTFKVRTGAAVYESGVGLTHFEDHKFTTLPFTPAEIELYVYGIGGRYSESDSPPEYLLNAAQAVRNRFNLSDEELYQLERGLTLEELKSTNMACRWPYAIMQSKIEMVDGIRRSDPRYPQALGTLFWSLLGAPLSSKILVNQTIRSTAVGGKRDTGGSLYNDLQGEWMQIMRSGDKLFETSSVRDDDAQEISNLARYNFMHAPTYRHLSPETRKLYIQANSPEGVLEASRHQRNVGSLVIRDAALGKVVGWRVVRQSENDPAVVEGKRMHVHPDYHGNGLGSKLLAVSEDLARDAGAVTMIINASGTSAEFFERQGYALVGRVENGDGVFSGNQLKPDKVRLIKYL